MGKVTTGFSMSLDGFVAGPQDEVDRVFKWYFSGSATKDVTSGDQVYKMNAEAAEGILASNQTTGVLVSARRTFDVAHAWGGRHPMNVPVVVLTHSVPPEWAGKESPFTFVTDGIESAIAKAQAIAGDKIVAVGAPSVVQQCLKAGLLDEIHIDLVPVLLFNGIRLFDHLGIDPVDLELLDVSASPEVMHITYRVCK